jgi:hypothetical protein
MLLVSFLLMTKKEILFLLAPCILFVWIATLSFSHADDCYPDQKVQQLMGERDEMLRKLKSGEWQATPEQLRGLVGESYRREHQIQEILADLHAYQSKRLGLGVFIGVAAQFYVVFRVKAGTKNGTAKS